MKLNRDFYARPVLDVARDCIGKVLTWDTETGPVSGRIVETEAYRGPKDRAAHSYGGRRTKRTEVMFGPAGHVYVFLVYGMYWNFNIVTGQIGQPEAALVRAVEPLTGQELMAERRRQPLGSRALTNGPGKVCQAFGIDGGQYAWDLCRGPLYVRDGPRRPVRRSARIGIDYAGAWAAKPWRFFDPDSRHVSRAPTKRPAP